MAVKTGSLRLSHSTFSHLPLIVPTHADSFIVFAQMMRYHSEIPTTAQKSE